MLIWFMARLRAGLGSDRNGVAISQECDSRQPICARGGTVPPGFKPPVRLPV